MGTGAPGLTPEASQTVAGGRRPAATSGPAGRVEGTPEGVPEVRGDRVWHPSGTRSPERDRLRGSRSPGHDRLRGSRSRTRSTPGYGLARHGRGLASRTQVHGKGADLFEALAAG